MVSNSHGTSSQPPAVPHVSEHHQPREDAVGACTVYMLNHSCGLFSSGVWCLCWLWQAQAGTQPLMMMLAVCSGVCSGQREVIYSGRSLLWADIELITFVSLSPGNRYPETGICLLTSEGWVTLKAKRSRKITTNGSRNGITCTIFQARRETNH